MSLYKPGDLAASGLGAKIQMYIIKKVRGLGRFVVVGVMGAGAV